MLRRILSFTLLPVFALALIHAATAGEPLPRTPLSSYVGVWRPVVPDSRFEQQHGDVARLEITMDGSNHVVVHQWGWCNAIGTVECAEPPAPAVAFSPDQATAPSRDTRAIVVARATSMLVVRLVDGALVAETYRRFGGSGRMANTPHDYSVVDRLEKTSKAGTR